ncbi:MAG: hypothetical protein KF760_03710 [Candidatus Eremiobacteraeota bacterium]|nr:hypothetical protein [Candidatus Eremiobacteraeota bacterium]MCW5870807.1 hypothetical protein [Candidatus Eremiobacteraeota bacterium]
MMNLYAKFSDLQLAERAVGALLDHGVAKNDISLVGPADGTDHEQRAKNGVTITTGRDAAAGAAEGAGLGLAVGALAALASLLIPGFGLVIGGGALATAAAAAAGTSAAGAIAGGVAGFLHDQGMEASVAHGFAQTVESGGAIVEVSAPSGEVAIEAVHHLLSKYGADQVSEVRADVA